MLLSMNYILIHLLVRCGKCESTFASVENFQGVVEVKCVIYINYVLMHF